MRQVASERLKQLLRNKERILIILLLNRNPTFFTNTALTHLCGKLSLSVKRVQVADHDISCFLKCYRLGRFSDRVQGSLLHVGVEGYSPAALIPRPAALRRRGRLRHGFHVICHLDTHVMIVHKHKVRLRTPGRTEIYGLACQRLQSGYLWKMYRMV